MHGESGPLNGQFAVVTGGSRGIGYATVLGLSHLGAEVAIVGRESLSVTSAVESARAAGRVVHGWVVDASQPTAAEQLRELAQAPVDILVASAAVMSERSSKLVHTSVEHWRSVLATNLDGVFHAMSAFVPSMLERRSGTVVALSACLGRMSGPGTAGGLAPYRISKAGVNALVRNTAAEMGQGRRGVFVDAVCPGHCRTDMGGADAPRSAEEGADTVVWLASRGNGGAETTSPTGVLWEDRHVVPW